MTENQKRRQKRVKNLSFPKRLKKTWNKIVITHLRRIGILKRLTLSFSLLLISIILMTFFSYFQYNKEINQNLDRYVSLLVQNVDLKITDTMKTYEDILLRFYNDNEILMALSENASLSLQTYLKTAAPNMNRTAF